MGSQDLLSSESLEFLGGPSGAGGSVAVGGALAGIVGGIAGAIGLILALQQ